MSWLSVAINKLAHKDPKVPGPSTVGTIAHGVAKPIGNIVTGIINGVADGRSVGQATQQVMSGVASEAKDKFDTAVAGADVALTAGQSFAQLMRGPVPWIICGIAVAAVLSARRR